MVHYKLTYFNCRGRAEIIRFVFAAAGVDYEDIRFEHDQWPAIKPTTPFGQAPILEIDGKMFGQSYSLARYIARKYHLAGKTDLEELQADMLVDCMDDTLQQFAKYYFTESGDKRDIKEELKKKFFDETLPAAFTNLENLLKANSGGDGYFVGDGLTWADLNFLTLFMWVEIEGQASVLDKYPKLKSLHERVVKLPKIAAWIAKRPVTQY